MNDDVYLPKPAAAVARHADEIAARGAGYLLSGRVNDVESATALSLYDILANDPQLPEIRSYLNGELDDTYPPTSGRSAWNLLVQYVQNVANSESAEVVPHQAIEHPPVDHVDPGTLYVPKQPAIPVAAPGIANEPLIDRIDHPNVVLFAGDKRTALHQTKMAAGHAGLKASGNTFSLAVARTSAALFQPRKRVSVLFGAMNFPDACQSPGTAILIHGIDLELVEGVRSGFAALPGAIVE